MSALLTIAVSPKNPALAAPCPFRQPRNLASPKWVHADYSNVSFAGIQLWSQATIENTNDILPVTIVNREVNWTALQFLLLSYLTQVSINTFAVA
jgi:hypothetical protein